MASRCCSTCADGRTGSAPTSAGGGTKRAVSSAARFGSGAAAALATCGGLGRAACRSALSSTRTAYRAVTGGGLDGGSVRDTACCSTPLALLIRPGMAQVSATHRRGEGKRPCTADLRVEPRGLEPLTPCLQSRCATNCAMAPGRLGRRSIVRRGGPLQRASASQPKAEGTAGCGPLDGREAWSGARVEARVALRQAQGTRPRSPAGSGSSPFGRRRGRARRVLHMRSTDSQRP